MEWKFKQLQKDDTHVGTEHLEQFNDPRLEDASTILVRESIQNSLDQKVDSVSGPVHVSFTLSDKLNKSDLSFDWFKSLEKHVNAKNSLKERNEASKFNFEDEFRYVTVEDFNTTGLRGNVELTNDPNGGEEDFYWFVRNIGRSGKSNLRGKWGIGKIVFPAASKIRTFFAFTKSIDRNEPALIGRTSQSKHSIENFGEEYFSEGYFGINPLKDMPAYTLPTSDLSIIDLFKKDFSLKRKNDQSGLSIVIPFSKEEISKDLIIKALIENYMYLIVNNLLSVSVHSQAESFSEELNAETIDNFIFRWDGLDDNQRKRIKSRFNFFKLSDKVDWKTGNYFNLKCIEKGSDCDDLKKLFKKEDELDRAIERYNEGEILIFEFPIIISNKHSNSKDESSFIIFIQKDANIDECDDLVIREGLTIIGEKSLSREGIKGVRSCLIAQSEGTEASTLVNFLGDAENVSHIKWTHETKHFRDKYVNGKKFLTFIKNSPLKLYKILTQSGSERIDNAFENYFQIETDIDDPNSNRGQKRRKRKKVDIPTIKRKKYILSRKLNGQCGIEFYPYRDQESDNSYRKFRAKFAYAVEDMAGKNCFDQYQIHDFNFKSSKQIKTSYIGCREISKTENSIDVEILDLDSFRLTVSGFDPNRDLERDTSKLKD